MPPPLQKDIGIPAKKILPIVEREFNAKPAFLVAL
jgi:hypothetical protein